MLNSRLYVKHDHCKLKDDSYLVFDCFQSFPVSPLRILLPGPSLSLAPCVSIQGKLLLAVSSQSLVRVHRPRPSS